MPLWEKGQSGNPAGRPKGLDPVLQANIYRALSERLPAALAALDACLKSKKLPLKLKAAEIIMDRVLGKADQKIDVNGALNISSISVNIVKVLPTEPATEEITTTVKLVE